MTQNNRRSEALSIIQSALEEYTCRWVDEQTTLGDFEGRGSAIDVFGVSPEKRLELLRRVRVARRQAEEMIGASILLIPHTPDATKKYYASILAQESGDLLRYGSVDSERTQSPTRNTGGEPSVVFTFPMPASNLPRAIIGRQIAASPPPETLRIGA